MRHQLTIALGIMLLTGSVRAAAPAAEGTPSMEQLQALLQQGKYQEVIRGAQKALALKGPAAQGLDRYELFMLRGEAALRAKANAQAIESYVSAAKETDDPGKKSEARAMEILVKKSKAQGYQPKSTTRPAAGGKPAGPIPIMEEADRKAAFEALYADELTAAAPKIKAANAATALGPIVEVARMLGDLNAIETAGTGSAEQTKKIAADLGAQSHLLIDGALKGINKRVEECWQQGSRTRESTRAGGGTGQRLYGLMGLTSVETNDLKAAIANCEKIAPVANDLATVTGGAELTADAREAERLLNRAKEVLNYDYANEGRYNRQPTQTQTPGKTGYR